MLYYAFFYYFREIFTSKNLMKAEKIYLLPGNIARKVKGAGLLRMLLMAGMLLLTMPAMAQYYNVNHTAGTVNVGGVNVTVTNVNGSTGSLCGYGPYKEGNGGPGSYTWTFGTPIVAVRFHITAVGPLDVVSVMINGSPYVLSASEVNPLPAPCSGNTAIVSGGVIVSGGGFNADATVDINTGSPINSFSIVSSGPSGVVASDFNIEPVLNAVPSFVFGSSLTFDVCQDASPTDISGLLSINDADNGQTEIWTVTAAPANGSLSGFGVPSSATSNGSTVTPSGLTYQPNSGFNGPDSFIVRIDDGTDTADILVHVNVNPTPDVTVQSSQAKCNLAPTDSIYFLSSVPGTTFSWSNDDNTTGLAFNGTGDIPSFIATNSTFAPVVSTLTVTPTAMGCVGTPKLYTLTVNPTPDVANPGDLTACNNNAVIVPNFSSNVSGTTYTWVNTNSTIGLATTGTGNILSFTGTNVGIEDSFGTITVTPSANSCVGTPQSFNITIHPTPMLTSELNNNMSCDNALFIYTPTSATSGTTYQWDRATVGGVTTAGTSGTGGISETLDNNTTGLVTVAYVYTLTANGCDNVQTVADTVVPTLALTSTLTPDSICNNTTFSYTPTSATPDVTFQWSRNPVYGIANAGATNSFNPLEVLHDTITVPVFVTYNYYTIYGICSSVQEDVTVQVNPSPMLSTTLTPAAICDSTLFTYVDSSLTPGTTYSWSRAALTEIANPANSDVGDTIREVLVNHATYPVQVTYAVTLTAFGCSNVNLVNVYVNPKPVLSSATTPSPVCSKAPFDYVPASATLTTTFAWSRAAVAGISNAAAHDTGSIHETLTNTTKLPITVLYIDTLTVNGCKNTDSIFLVVNPLPRLSSKDTVAICNKETFNYLPTSATPGAAYDWSRGFVLGIDALAGNGSDNPNEQLINTTNFKVTVTYVYTVTANNCKTTDDTVRVIVRPTPVLFSEDTVSACSKMPFAYVPASLTPSVTYTWSRAKVNGILPATGTGTGSINETLTDTAIFTINTFYKYKLNVEGCVDSQNVMVMVNPAPYTPEIGIMPPASLCLGTQYQNFGATTLPAAGTTYIWSAINASVMATGNTRQNALVTFDKTGDAKVIVTSSIGSTGCRIADTFAVAVSTTVAETPKVIYYNGQFMCLQSSAGTTYQWGYDDALTLDSNLIHGEVNQTIFVNSPDLTYKNFWVMTTLNGCTQKTYYNVPMGVTNVNTDAASVKVYPNPANANINVEINTLVDGNIQVEVMNLLGQKVSAAEATDRKATINVANLASGCYMVNCYREGVKIATAKFIKN